MTDTKTPKIWRGLTLTGSALALSLGAPVLANPLATPRPDMPVAQSGPTLVDGEATAPAAEQGEAGEAGLTRTEDPDVNYAVRLALVDAHLRAGLLAYAAGLVPEAMALVGHPEAEVMSELREDLEAKGVEDFSPLLDAMMDVIADGGSQDQLETAYDAVRLAVLAAYPADADAGLDKLAAVEALARGASIEFAMATEEGEAAGVLESRGFIAAARALAADYLADADPRLAKAAATVVEALDSTAEAYAALDAGGPADPSILAAAAARIEFAVLAAQ
jgi:hypothetical protein